ncbi:MAG: hypothetical protein JWN40_4993 [Phycisphaerales bacterium]|nr:hypothetical protein [Phycisphaerales bacterium]
MNRFNRRASKFLGAIAAATALFFTSPPARAADHGDAPNVAGDQAADLGDTYAFLDPNDNTQVVLIMTFRGFIVPGEAVNFVTFDPNVLYRFDIENTGDAKADLGIDVTFSPRTAAAEPQTATIKIPGHKTFTAPTTIATQAAVAPVPTVTTRNSGTIKFFAGEVDDPFFFDIPAFARFLASVKAGSPDATVFSRGRDTFAGYNILAIAVSVPAELIRGKSTNNIIGVDAATFRRTPTYGETGVFKSKGKFRQIDRSGNPAVNVALIPFARKNEYNARGPRDDAKGRFADDIVGILTGLGTDEAHIAALAGVAVTHGDYEHLDLSIPNTGAQGGTNAAAAFPNGRRLSDDAIDTILSIIANGAALSDNVGANDVTFRNEFPFLAAPHQPLPSGTLDDNTRN